MSQMKRFTKTVPIKMGSSEIQNIHHKTLQHLIKSQKENTINADEHPPPARISPDETGWIG